MKTYAILLTLLFTIQAHAGLESIGECTARKSTWNSVRTRLDQVKDEIGGMNAAVGAISAEVGGMKQQVQTLSGQLIEVEATLQKALQNVANQRDNFSNIMQEPYKASMDLISISEANYQRFSDKLNSLKAHYRASNRMLTTMREMNSAIAKCPEQPKTSGWFTGWFTNVSWELEKRSRNDASAGAEPSIQEFHSLLQELSPATIEEYVTKIKPVILEIDAANEKVLKAHIEVYAMGIAVSKIYAQFVAPEQQIQINTLIETLETTKKEYESRLQVLGQQN